MQPPRWWLRQSLCLLCGSCGYDLLGVLGVIWGLLGVYDSRSVFKGCFGGSVVQRLSVAGANLRVSWIVSIYSCVYDVMGPVISHLRARCDFSSRNELATHRGSENCRWGECCEWCTLPSGQYFFVWCLHTSRVNRLSTRGRVFKFGQGHRTIIILMFAAHAYAIGWCRCLFWGINI